MGNYYLLNCLDKSQVIHRILKKIFNVRQSASWPFTFYKTSAEACVYYQRELFYRKSTIGTTIEPIEANNNMYCLQKPIGHTFLKFDGSCYTNLKIFRFAIGINKEKWELQYVSILQYYTIVHNKYMINF